MANALAFDLNKRVAELYPAKPKQAPMADPESVAAARQGLRDRAAIASRPGYAMSGQMYAQNPVDLPPELFTGDRKIDDLTRTGLLQGVPYDELARNAGIALDYASRPMSEGGGKEPTPGLLDYILPAAMGFATGGIGALNGLSALGSSVLGATTSGLFGQATAPLPLVGAGMGVVGAGAMNSLSQLKDQLTTGKGFTNTDLGLKGENLDLPGLSNAPPYVPPQQGVGVGALNYVDSLGRATMEIPGLNLVNAPKPTGTNQYPYGGLTGSMLYNPVSLGGSSPPRNIPMPDLPSLGGGMARAAPSVAAGAAGGVVPSGPGAAPPSGPGSAPPSGGALIEGGAATGPGLVGSTDAGSAGAPSFDATLTGGMAAGRGPANALAGSGMGAGLIPLTERDMIRNPGYQPRPFGNYVLR